MQHVKSYANICMLASTLPLSDKMCWACFMTEHCDLTMKFSNTSHQRRKRSAALSCYVLTRRSSTNHSTQHSALTLKYLQNTSYQLAGMNRLYAVMTISAHWFNICSRIWERIRRLSSPLVTCLATVTDRHMAGVGNLRPGNKYMPCKHGPCIRIFVAQDRTQIASKQNSVINRYLVSQETYLSVILLVFSPYIHMEDKGKSSLPYGFDPFVGIANP